MKPGSTLGWERCASGVLIVRLDTLLDRNRQHTPFETALADSVGRGGRPRLAWLADTLASRIRRIRPDSLACWLIPDRDR